MEIKDLILQENPVQDEAVEKNAVKKGPSITYTVKICSGCDVAIERKSPRSTSLLVLLVSQNQYYIKKQDVIDVLTIENYTKFFYSLTDARLELPNCTWTDALYKGKAAAETLLTLLRYETFVELAKKSLINTSLLRGLYNLDWYNLAKLKDIYKKNPALYSYIYKTFTKENMLSLFYSSLIENVFTLADYLSLEYAKQFLEYSIHSPLTEGFNQFRTAIKYNENCILHERFFCIKDDSAYRYARNSIAKLGVSFEPKRFIEYITYDCCVQGYADNFESFLYTWSDSLTMQIELFGKIKEKYPKSLNSTHQKLSYLTRQKKKIVDELKWKKAVEDMEDFEYSGSDFVIMCPKTPEDMRDEACQQNNCLTGYIDNVTNGFEKVLFLRNKKDLDKSLVTIELYNDGRIGQVYGANNSTPSIKCLDFVSEWAKNKNLIWTGAPESIHAARCYTTEEARFVSENNSQLQAV